MHFALVDWRFAAEAHSLRDTTCQAEAACGLAKQALASDNHQVSFNKA